MSKVRLIWITPDAERIIGYCARVSNSKNQDNPDVSKLLKYCIDNKHWSVFEQANLCCEIITSRAIATQILRHRSFSFEELSQRFSEVAEYEKTEARRQDLKNRQNSIDDLDETTKEWFEVEQSNLWTDAYTIYKKALDKGVAKEVARMVLPLSTQTKLYMNGTIRSYLTYLMVRLDASTQKEHRDIALECQNIFKDNLPIISRALGWLE